MPKSSAFPWEQMVPFSLPIISFTPMLKNLQTNKTYQRQNN